MPGIKDSVVNILLKAKNAVSPAVDEAAQSLDDAQQRANELVKELEQLDKQNELISQFKALSGETERVTDNMHAAQAELARLQAEYKNTTHPTAQMRAALANARTESQLATGEYKKQQRELSTLSRRLSKAGLDGNDMGRAEQQLGQRVEATRRDMEKSTTALKDHATQQGKTTKSTDRLAKGFRTVRNLLIAGAIGKATKELVALTDSYTELQRQLIPVTDGQDDLNHLWAELHRTANDLSIPMAQAVETYRALAQGSKDLNVTQADLISITRTLTASFIASGSSADKAASTAQRLARGLAQGELDGRALNQVLKQSPEFARALSDGLGITISQLVEMGKKGEISADQMIAALLKSADQVENTFSKLPETVGDHITQLRNDLLSAFGEINVDGLTESIDEFRDVITDPAMVESLSTLAQAILKIGEWTASAAKATVSFATAMGENIAEVVSGDGGAGHSLSYLQSQLAAVQTALKEPWIMRDIGLAFKSTEELAQMEQRLAIRIAAAQSATKKSSKATKENTDASRENKDAQQESANAALANASAQQKVASETQKAAQALGIDLNMMLTGVDSAAQKAIDNFAKVASNIKSMGATTDQASNIIQAALEKAFDTTQSVDDLKALRAQIEALAEAGKLSDGDASSALAAVNAQISALNETTAQATETTKENTAAKKENKAATEATTQAEKAHGEAVHAGIKDGESLTAMISGATAALRAQTEALGGNRDAVQQLAAQLYTESARGYHAWEASVKQATDQLQRQADVVSQVLASQSGDLGQFIRNAESALRNTNLLGEQTLGPLRTALDQARQQMQSLSDSANSTLESLESQLAQLQGDNARVEQIANQQKMLELQNKLNEAQQAGNTEAVRDLEKSLRLQQEIHNIKMQEAQQRSAPTPATPAAPTSASAPAANRQTTVHLVAPSGRSANVTTPDMDALLNILDEAKLRSI